MATVSEAVERHHKLIIIVLAAIILLLASSCLFHEVIPICHYVSGRDDACHLSQCSPSELPASYGKSAALGIS